MENEKNKPVTNLINYLHGLFPEIEERNNKVYVFSKEHASASLKRLILLTSRLPQNERVVDVIIGHDEPLTLELLEKIKDCECNFDILLNIYANNKKTLNKIVKIFTENKNNNINIGKSNIRKYNGTSFIVTNTGYYFQTGADFSIADAVFSKDKITELLKTRVKQMDESVS